MFFGNKQKANTPGNFTTLFSGVTLNGDTRLYAGTKAEFDNVGLVGELHGPIEGTANQEVAVAMRNVTANLTIMSGIDSLGLGNDANIRVAGRGDATIELNELDIDGTNASFILEAGTLVVNVLRLSKGAKLVAPRIHCKTLVLAPGGQIEGYVTTTTDLPKPAETKDEPEFTPVP